MLLLQAGAETGQGEISADEVTKNLSGRVASTSWAMGIQRNNIRLN